MVDSKSETFWFATDKSFSIRAAHALEHSSSLSTGEFVVSKVGSVVNGEIVVVVISLSVVCVDSASDDVELEGNSEDKPSVVGAREGSVEGSVAGISDDSEEIDSDEDDSDDDCGLVLVAVDSSTGELVTSTIGH